ncbi:MAG TPA: EAL domain-containing protein [Gaiellales bacterium]|jgi:diguanylate cyclase (GGDEF)-like protein/PAS domain S-box-containing protein
MQPHGDNHPGNGEGAYATVRVLPGTSYEFELRHQRWVMSAAGPEIESITGYPPSDFIDHARRSYGSIVHPEDYDGMVSLFRDAIQRRAPYAIEYRVIHADGSTRWVQGHGRGAFDGDGNVTRIEGLFFDVTERRTSEERLAHLALHDPLTDLPNRALFQEHLTVAIANARRSGSGGAVLFIDLDDFKLVNDSFGHAVGDELLVLVAQRLRESCRAGDVVARQGGDEFLVLVQGTPGDSTPDEAAQTVAANLRVALAKPFGLASTDLYITPSIGASLFPADGDTAETLLKHADIAMYAAKDAGRDGYRLYQPPKRDSSVELAIASQLRQAERRDELELYYQPIVALEQSCIVGAEALLRWNRPGAGTLLPGEFLPAAERTGLIRPITAWVLERACIEARRWCDHDLDLYASINLPPAYWQPGAIRRVIATIESFGLPADRVMIEFTEEAAMTDIADLGPLLDDIHSQGLRLAIDDFGTGYSSLGRLSRLRPSMIKIDRSFVKDLPADREAGVLVETMITMAQKLGIQCLAEGIETEAQLKFLREIGCPLGQGYLYSRPLPVSRFNALITGEERRAA